MIRPRAITRLLGPRTLWYGVAIVALIEAIYLAEEFTGLMLFVVSRGGSALETAVLAFLKTPNVIDFALPIAILIALFFAILNARENNELMVCAAAGVPWTRIPRFALMVGIAGFCISLLFASTITPYANHLYRLMGSSMLARAVVQDVTETAQTHGVRSFQDRTFITTPNPDPKTRRGQLFLFQPDTGDGWRASQANDWDVIGPREDGSYAVQLKSYRDYVGRTEAQTEALRQDLDPLQTQLQFAQWDVTDVNLVFRLEDLLRPINRAPTHHETVLVPIMLAGLLGPNDAWRGFDARIGNMLGRAVACIFAALVAVAAAAWSGTRIGRLAALPVSVVVIMAGDIVARTFLAEAAPAGGAALAQNFGLVLLGAVLLPGAALMLRREAVIVPRRGQG